MRMISSLLGFLSVLCFTIRVSAYALAPRNPLNFLVDRTIAIPPACQSQCEPILATFTACTTVACYCSNNNEPDILTCAKCYVTLIPTLTEIDIVQNVLNIFVFDCLRAGFNVSPMTVLGGTAGTPTANADAAAGGLIPSLLAASASLGSEAGGPTAPPSQITNPPTSPATVTVTTSGGGFGSGGSKSGSIGLKSEMVYITVVFFTVCFALL